MALSTSTTRKISMRKSAGSRVSQLWRKRNKVRVFKCIGGWTFFDTGIWGTGQGNGNRPSRLQWKLRTWKSEISESGRKLWKYEKNCTQSIRTKVLALCKKHGNCKTFSGDEQRRNHRGSEASCTQSFSQLVQIRGKTRVYDIRNAGRHHRFTVSGHLVHNCGYGGSTGALISMGALDMGLKEDELPGLISDWRTANPKIVQFWWDIEKAAVETVKDHQERHVRRIGFQFYANTLWMVLPSGRKLAYIKPKLQPNRFGRMAIAYEGLNQSNKWVRGETYSGKLVENCIAAGTEVLTDRGFVAIEDVRIDDLLWDGLWWVSHEGLIDKGVQDTVIVSTEGREGIHMTANHRILTEGGWIRSGESAGLNWAKVRTPDGFGTLQASQIAQTSQASQATNGISVRSSECQERVYDIRNCGPRHRFCVFDRGAGELRIVSNCTQATARDILAEAMWRLEQAGLDIVGHVHDEVILEVPKGSITVDEVCAIMNQNPTWADGLPLDSDGYTGNYYFKS